MSRLALNGSIYDDCIAYQEHSMSIIFHQAANPSTFPQYSHVVRRASHGVFVWESNGGSTEPSNALFHQFSLIVVKEKTPDAEVPASSDNSGGGQVNEPVPEVASDIFVSSHCFELSLKFNLLNQ